MGKLHCNTCGKDVRINSDFTVRKHSRRAADGGEVCQTSGIDAFGVMLRAAELDTTRDDANHNYPWLAEEFHYLSDNLREIPVSEWAPGTYMT